MEPASIVSVISAIFIGAAVLASVALHLRLPILIAYILVGMLIGPFGFGLAMSTELLSDIAYIGIMFLLFLLGLDMPPAKLAKLFGETMAVGITSCLLFFVLGLGFALAFGLSMIESSIVGAATMFSSTIVGIKLLPTTVLHHRHVGELMISILLFQDLLAILLLVIVSQAEGADTNFKLLLLTLLFPLMVGGCFLFVRYVLLKLLARFDAYYEYVFLIAIGWCLGMAELFYLAGMSHEIGAFVAGVSLGTSPISQHIADSLKPLRDFFLVLFFFALGAQFNLSLLTEIWLPVIVLTAILVLAKPWVFSWLFRWLGEAKHRAREVSFRLAQGSEFSLLLAYLATAANLISIQTSHIIQAATIFSFAISTYIVIRRYPSPMAVDARLRRD